MHYANNLRQVFIVPILLIGVITLVENVLHFIKLNLSVAQLYYTQKFNIKIRF